MENKYETDKIQSTAVKIRTKKQNITIAAAYCPPGKTLKQEDYQEFFATLGERFILGGDYDAKNAKWGSRLTTTKGREFMKAINSINGNIHTTGRPTYWPADRNKIPPPKYRSDPATELQGSYTATQQDQAIGTVLVRVVIRAKSGA
jgi:hypothetical protein